MGTVSDEMAIPQSCFVALVCLLLFAHVAADCANGLVYEDAGVCECFTCWTGEDCSTLIEGCALSCETNEGYVQTEYWTDVAMGEPEADIPSSYRTDYLDPQVWHPGDVDPPPGIFGSI